MPCTKTLSSSKCWCDDLNSRLVLDEFLQIYHMSSRFKLLYGIRDGSTLTTIWEIENTIAKSTRYVVKIKYSMNLQFAEVKELVNSNFVSILRSVHAK